MITVLLPVIQDPGEQVGKLTKRYKKADFILRKLVSIKMFSSECTGFQGTHTQRKKPRNSKLLSQFFPFTAPLDG